MTMAVAMGEAIANFPAPLVCPACQAPAQVGTCSCAAQTRLELDHDIPRFLFGQKYWGETSSANMARVLDLADSMHWSDALAVVCKGEAVNDHLHAEVGPDFVYAMPWTEIDTVLDIGAGMGFMTALLAKYAKQVVALEAVPERARFIRKRAEHDRLNIHPVIGSATALPFAPESFDLITLNGVFEYIGLWGKGDPEQVQRDFLAKMHRLLRPGGFLYVGIETRLALGCFLGARDHSGLAFTSLMPRWLANWYCKVRSVPFYGSEHAARDYRTYTYTPAQYGKMFRAAGFETVTVHGAFDGYNRQLGLYDMEDREERLEIRRRIDAPSSPIGWLKRKLANNRFLYKTLEDEVVVFGRKKKQEAPLVWAGVNPGGKVGQINTHTKVMAVCFQDGKPTSIAEGAKVAAVEERMERGFEQMRRVDELYGAQASRWPMRWAAPIEKIRYQGRPFYRYEYAQGTNLSTLLLPPHFGAKTLATFDRVLDVYPEMCDRLSRKWPTPTSVEPWRELIDELEAVPLDDAKLRSQARAATELLRAGRWQPRPVHGDFVANNIVEAPSGTLVLIDWENFSEAGLVGVDLVRFYYDAIFDARRLPPAKGDRLASHLKEKVGRVLVGIGVAREDFEAMEALYIAHQVALSISKGVGASELLEMYLSRRYALK
jgi:SAM-dependent methyltransferase/aminoglycoside phosphotransferase (APT) family kinase protein